MALLLLLAGCGVPGTWTVLNPPAAPGVPIALATLDCAGSACLAIGPAGTPNAAAWNGEAWRLVPPPPVSAFGYGPTVASCASPTWCVVFGLSDHAVWNGTAWTTASHPYGEDYLRSLSCPAPDRCYAVFDPRTSMSTSELRSWDGTRWTTVAGGTDHPDIDYVSCPAVDACLVVQHTAQPVLRWADGQWSTLAVEGPAAEFRDLACPAPTMCALIGLDRSGRHPLAATWSGGASVTATVVDDTADGSDALDHVDCASPVSCVAESGWRTGASFDGTAWRAVPLPDGGGLGRDRGVACPTGGRCFLALGATSAPDAPAALWSWDGATMTALPPLVGPDGGVPTSSFTDVACPAPSTCLAVGTYRTATGTKAFAERGAGTTWTLLPDIPVGDATSVRSARVDCASATVCMAVLNVSDRDYGVGRMIVAMWNGTAWTPGGGSVPADAAAVPLDVACGGPSSCVVVGYRDDITHPFTDRWDGHGWSLGAGPATLEPMARDTRVNALSCAGPAFCAFLTTSVQGQRTLVQFWNGTDWRTAPDPLPASGTARGVLLDIDCPVAATCVTVGWGYQADQYGARSSSFGLAVTWNGTGWTTQRISYGAGPVMLANVSCAGVDRCVATVGGEGTEHQSALVYAVAGGRYGWAPSQSKVDTDARWQAAARSVACASDSCVAVGDKATGPATRPLALRYQL